MGPAISNHGDLFYVSTGNWTRDLPRGVEDLNHCAIERWFKHFDTTQFWSSFDISPASSPKISTQYPPEIWVFINIEYQDDQRATIKYFSLKRHKMKSCIFLLFKFFIVPLKNEHTTLLSLNSYSFKKNYVQTSPWAGVYYTFIGYIIFSFLVLWDKSRCYYHILV